jgi:hypothetical protein
LKVTESELLNILTKHYIILFIKLYRHSFDTVFCGKKKKTYIPGFKVSKTEKKIRCFLNMKSFSICCRKFTEIHQKNFSMIYKKNDQNRKFCDIIEVNIFTGFYIGNFVKT